MKRCVINVAVGAWYPRGQDRLRTSLHAVGFQGDFICWRDSWPPGSPPHSELPYGFKSYAFQDVVKQGYDTILWLDCSCWAIRPLEPLFNHIEQEGHVFSYEGWKAGQWLKDEALANLGITRDEALEVPLIGGMFMGICLTHERSRKWLEGFCKFCQDGTTLPGQLRNVNHSVSNDDRCLGHVADQSVASILAHRLGMGITYPPTWRDWGHDKKQFDPSTVILAAGM
jgi:hypothetical protein